MRNRLVLALVGTTFAVIALYGVPRAFVLADRVHDEEQSRLDHSASLLGVALEERRAAGRPIDAAWLAGLLADGEGLLLVPESGASLSVGTSGNGDGDIVQSREVPGVGRFELVRSGDQVGGMVSEAILPLALLGLGLLAASAVFGVVLARRLARPFQQLSASAQQLGRGRLDSHVPHYDIPEAEAIGAALRHADSELQLLVGRERAFAVNASHQLLTPLAALRLELEDLTMWPQMAPEVAEQLGASLADVDRLQAAVDALIGDAARARSPQEDLDLGSTLDEVAARWRPSITSSGRELVSETVGPVIARVDSAAVSEILDILVENAVRHGHGRVSLRASAAPTSLRVEVSDEGARSVPIDVLHRPEAAHPASRRGLARAAELAEAVGGQLRIEDADHTCVVLLLPRGA